MLSFNPVEQAKFTFVTPVRHFDTFHPPNPRLCLKTNHPSLEHRLNTSTAVFTNCKEKQAPKRAEKCDKSRRR